jgi:hypothetical protein
MLERLLDEKTVVWEGNSSEFRLEGILAGRIEAFSSFD